MRWTKTSHFSIEMPEIPGILDFMSSAYRTASSLSDIILSCSMCFGGRSGSSDA